MEHVTDISFSEAEHRYYDKFGNNYTSVTTLIGKYTEDFNADFWAMFTALKEHHMIVKPEPRKNSIYIGNKLMKLKDLQKDSLFIHWVDEVKARWKGLTAEACLRGNNVHNELEDSINISKGDLFGQTNDYIQNLSSSPTKGKVLQTIHDLDKTKLEEKYPFVYHRLKGYIERGFSIFAEKKVFLSQFLIAGMIDVPLFLGNYFAILDWKTNKDELHDTAGYYRKKKIGGVFIKTDEWVPTDECLKYPLDMVPASKFHKYALQLSLYAYILEQWGYTLMTNGLEIIHFPLGKEPKLIKIPYMKKEIEILLNHYKQTLVA